MRKIFIFFSFLALLFSFPFVSFAKSEWHSTIPEPVGQYGEFYLADKTYLYQFIVDLNFIEMSGSNITVTGIECLADSSIGNNSVRLYFENNSAKQLNLYYNRFLISNGTASLSRSYTIPIPTNDRQYYLDFSLVNPASEGVWSSGINWINFQTFLPLSITWAETPDYTSDFAAFDSYLSDISQDVSDIADDVSTQLSLINQRLSSLVTAFNTNWSWFKTTYYNYISGRWTMLESKLDEIISLLDDQNATTIHVDESYADDINGFVQNEHNVMSQASIDSNELNSNINAAFDELPSFQNGFQLIRNVFDAFVTQVPQVYIVLLFSLVFGIVLTVIGKKMS